MALLKRLSPAERTLSGRDRSDSPLLKGPGSPLGPPLLSRDEVPPWYIHNQYILARYRPVTPSTSLCLKSLLYLHNETECLFLSSPGRYSIAGQWSPLSLFLDIFPGGYLG